MRRRLTAAAALVAMTAAVLFLADATNAMAQITQAQTFTVLQRQVWPISTQTTATTDIPEGATAVYVTGIMTDAVASDPVNEFALVVYVSANGGVDWVRAFGPVRWQGGTVIDKATGLERPAYFDVGFSNDDLANGRWVGYKVRAEIDVRASFRFGLNAVVTPPDVPHR